MQYLVNAIIYLGQSLLAGTEGLTKFALSTMRVILNTMFKLPGWLWTALSYIGAAFTAVFAVTETALGYVDEAFAYIAGGLDTVDKNGLPGAAEAASITGDILDGINTFIPLEECFAFLTVYFFLKILVDGVRTVKAWMPMIHGWGFSN